MFDARPPLTPKWKVALPWIAVGVLVVSFVAALVGGLLL